VAGVGGGGEVEMSGRNELNTSGASAIAQLRYSCGRGMIIYITKAYVMNIKSRASRAIGFLDLSLMLGIHHQFRFLNSLSYPR
jgi:hypothetical protein